VKPEHDTTHPSASLRRVLLSLALTQFVASFAGSSMNVSISSISEDLGTTVHGVQTAITLFLLCMAALMIPGSKLTDILGRKRCLTGGAIFRGAIFRGVGAMVGTGIFALLGEAEGSHTRVIDLGLGGDDLVEQPAIAGRQQDRNRVGPLDRRGHRRAAPGARTATARSATGTIRSPASPRSCWGLLPRGLGFFGSIFGLTHQATDHRIAMTAFVYDCDARAAKLRRLAARGARREAQVLAPAEH